MSQVNDYKVGEKCYMFDHANNELHGDYYDYDNPENESVSPENNGFKLSTVMEVGSRGPNDVSFWVRDDKTGYAKWISQGTNNITKEDHFKNQQPMYHNALVCSGDMIIPEIKSDHGKDYKVGDKIFAKICGDSHYSIATVKKVKAEIKEFKNGNHVIQMIYELEWHSNGTAQELLNEYVDHVYNNKVKKDPLENVYKYNVGDTFYWNQSADTYKGKNWIFVEVFGRKTHEYPDKSQSHTYNLIDKKTGKRYQSTLKFWGEDIMSASVYEQKKKPKAPLTYSAPMTEEF
jgi:hypothetical protein